MENDGSLAESYETDNSEDAWNAFTDYNENRPHSSIDYLPPRQFRRKFLNDQSFWEGIAKKLEVRINEKWAKVLQFSGSQITSINS